MVMKVWKIVCVEVNELVCVLLVRNSRHNSRQTVIILYSFYYLLPLVFSLPTPSPIIITCSSDANISFIQVRKWVWMIITYLFVIDRMDPRKYQQPSAPPPPYDSVANNNRQEYHSDQYSNQNYPGSREERMPDFDQFVNRYESEYFLQCTLDHRYMSLFSQSKFCGKII